MIIEVTAQRKSSTSHQNGGCVQVGHAQCRRAPRKASTSQGMSNSVLVGVGAPHSLDPGQEMALEGYVRANLVHVSSDLAGLDHFFALFTGREWMEFIAAAKRGEFDLDEDGLLPELEQAQG